MNSKPSQPFNFSGRDKLLRNPQNAAIYLEECYSDGDIKLFQEALRNVAKAQEGGVKGFAKATGLNRSNLYRTLSKKGNPNSNTLKKVLDGLGIEMKVSFLPKRNTLIKA